MTDTSFLSVRVPAELHGRIKRLAAGRRTSVQALVRAAVEDYLREHDRTPPDLGQTIATLRAHEAELRSSGIEHLYVFGSIVRGEARCDSDIDVVVDVDPDSPVSILRILGLQDNIEAWLGRKIDFGERAALREPIRTEMEREAIRVF